MLISFHPTSAKLGSGFVKGSKNHDRIALELSHTSAFDDIDTADGQDLKKRAWTLTLYESEIEAENENVASEGGIGVFSLGYTDDAIAGWACIGQRAFQRLLDGLLAGRMLEYLTTELKWDIHNDGPMRYGHDPDGRELIWDTRIAKHVHIVGVQFTVAITPERLDKGSDDENVPTEVTAIIEQPSAQIPAEFTAVLRKVTNLLTWIAVGVGVLVIKELFFR